MARKARPSDPLQNARKRARRAADRLEREGNSAAANRLRQAAAVGGETSIGKLDAMRTAALGQVKTVSIGTRNVKSAPRAKRPSDLIYNARRRIRRQAEKLEREAKSLKGKAKELASSFAKMLRGEAEKTKGTKLGIREKMEELTRLNKLRERTRSASFGMSSVARRNQIFMQQLNAAGTRGADSAISEREKSIFWIATKGLWPDGSNVPRNERYEKILQHFYTSETSDARDFRDWAKRLGVDLQSRFGDLQLVFDYIVNELNKDLPTEDGQDIDYPGLSKKVLTLM